MCSSYIPVTLCSILCKGSNKYLATCQKQFFWYLHRKMSVNIGGVFTLCGQGHLSFCEERERGQEEEEKEGKKYSSEEVMLTFEPVYL